LKKAKYLLMLAVGAAMTIAIAVPALADDSLNITVEPIQGTPYSHHEIAQQNHVPFPTDIQITQQGGRNFLHKTFTVPTGVDPNELVEADFTLGGYRYRHSNTMLRETTPDSSSKTAMETRTVDSETNERAAIIAMLGSRLPYSDEYGYTGELLLLPETLTISEAGRTSYTYIVSDVRQFENLADNDMARIPETTVKNGLALSLQSVDWEVTGWQTSGLPAGYTAIAHYSAPATGTRASGYTATAIFSGEVTRELAGESTFTIVYEGEQVIIPFNHIPLLVAGLIIAGCLVALIIIWRLRKNLEVYVYQAGVPELYSKMRVSLKRPIIELRQLSDVEVRLMFDKHFAKKLMDQRIFVVSKFRNTRFDLNGMRVVDLWLAGDQDSKKEERLDD